MDLRRYLLRPGDICTAFGRIVSADGLVTFNPPMPSRGVPSRTARRPSNHALPITAIDLTRLVSRSDSDGVIRGMATVTLIWNEGSLVAVEQHEEQPPYFVPEWTDPPCPTPVGGWPQTDDVSLPDALVQELEGAEMLVTMTLFSPPKSSQVLVLTVTDKAETTRMLGPELAARVCIVQSRYSAAQVADVGAQVQDRFTEWAAYRSGVRNGPDGQVTIKASVIRILPEIVEWAADIPDDLVTITPWLDPTRIGPAASREL